MSKKDEALKLSLEALETEHSAVYGTSRTARAITAIREALAAQPAQQQEPVATVIQFDGEKIIDASMEFFDKYPIGTELYTSPPASKPWVGLTDEEKSDLWCESTGRDCVNEDTHVFADAIEAKLKEKNT